MTRWLIPTLCCAIAATAVTATPPVSGRLCVTGAECRDVSCGDPVLAPAEPRSFVFTTTSARYLGRITPAQASIPCTGYGTVSLRVVLPDKSRRGGADAVISGNAGSTWNLPLTAREILEPVAIRLVPGTYSLVVNAPDALPFRSSFKVAEQPTAITAELQRVPRLSGTVITSSAREPVAGALITTDTGGKAVADPAGRFSVAADPESWPASVTVSAPGYAEAVVAVPRARVSTTLEPVALSTGRSVHVTLEQSEPGQVQHVELFQLIENGRKLGRSVKTVAVAAEAPAISPVTFAFVPSGQYMVLAKGSREWERLGEPVIVTAEEDARITLQIIPFDLEIRTKSEGATLPNARVTLRNREAYWQAAFVTGDEGEASLRLWQGGRVRADVAAKGVTPYVATRTIADGDREWTIDLPSHEIAGVVTDRESGAPVAGAGMILRIVNEAGYSLSVRSKTDGDGYFRFAPVAYGKHTLKAAARGYTPAEMTYYFREPEPGRVLTLKLDRGARSEVTVVDGRGRPVAGARVIDFSGPVQIGRTHTNESGTIPLLLAPGETRDFYVVPRDGSFGYGRITGGTPKATVTVPDGVSRIVLRTETESRIPIANMTVAVRYNGRLIPPEVIQTLSNFQGARIVSGADGAIVLDHMPPGLYEIWPAGSREELRALSMGTAPPAPVRIAAVPGENVATLTFASTRKP